MDSAAVVDLARQALWMTMIISGPLLAVGLIVGLVVGIFQAATSINEQTLSFVPKLIIVGIALALAGGATVVVAAVLLGVGGRRMARTASRTAAATSSSLRSP